MSAMDQLLDRARRSGIEHFTRDELALMREHLETLAPRDRVRAVFPFGESLAEPAIDGLWERIGRQPTADEYRALAELFMEAALECENNALAALMAP